MLRPAIVECCQMFDDGRPDFTDVERERRPATMSTPDMVQRVEDIIRSNFKVGEAHIACSENSKSIWMEDSFPTMIRFRQLF